MISGRIRLAALATASALACGDPGVGVVKGQSSSDAGSGRPTGASGDTTSTGPGSSGGAEADGGMETDDVGETAGGQPCEGVNLPAGIVPRYASAARAVPGLALESIDIRSPRTTCDGYEPLRCHESGFGWAVEIRLAKLVPGTFASGSRDVGAYGECWSGKCGGTTAILEDCTPLDYLVEIYDANDTCVAGRIDFTPALARAGEDPIDQLYFVAPRCG